ncbi:MAG: phage tail assembly chaperone [Marinomonas sp.]|uniref:phage tail assembly chaperone n=1 Tax=Marinomonas sp. TaxID=1904862 RepID=UPI003F9CCC40
MRFFKRHDGGVVSFESHQVTNSEKTIMIEKATSKLNLTVQYVELEDANNMLNAFDVDAIDVPSFSIALASSTFAINLSQSQSAYDLEQSYDNKTALDLAKAEYESCAEYIALKSAKESLEQYEIAVQRFEIAQGEYESCGEYVELERIKATKIWIHDDVVEMTEKEIQAHANPPVSDEQLATTARAQRDELLEQFTWRYERHARETRLGVETTDALSVLDAYAQSLADVPQQDGFPTAIEWPQAPA